MLIIRPIRKFYTGHHLRPHPLRLFRQSRRVLQRALFHVHFLQRVENLLLLFLIKSGAHTSDKSQLTAAVKSQNQRSEIFSAPSRCRPPRHHGIQFVNNLEFQPLRRATARVPAVDFLADNSFQVFLFRCGKKFYALLEHVLRVAHPFATLQNTRQQFLSYQQRRFPQVKAIVIQQIKAVIGQRNRLMQFRRRILNTNTIL